MTQQAKNTAFQPTDGGVANVSARSAWGLPAVCGWVLLFISFAFCLALPNNKWPDNRPITRWQLLLETTSIIDVVWPPQDDPEARFIRGNSGWRYFPQRLDLLAVAGVVLAGAWGAGSLVLRLVRQPGLDKPLLEFVFAMALGLSALSLLTLGVGLSGFLSRALMASLVAAAVVCETVLRLRKRATHFGQAAAAPRDTTPRRIPFAWLWLAVLAPFLLAMLLGSLLPSIDFDVNEYHFQGPKEYFQKGQIEFLPHNVYTSFPFGTEMLTLLAMVLRDDWYRGALAGKCVLMCFAPLTALALFVAGRRWFGTTAGMLAAVLYLTTPWTYRISTIAYAEGGLSFFLLMSLLAVLVAIVPRELDHERTSNDAPSEKKSPPLCFFTPRRFLLAGLLAGSAMACKYPAVISVVLPLFGLCCATARKTASGSTEQANGISKRLAAPLAFGIGVLIAVGPWLVKNTVETGNPVYPLLYTVFGGRDWDAQLNAKWRNGHKPPNYAMVGDWSLTDMAVDVAARNDWVNPLLFAFAPAAFLRRDRRRLVRWLWLYTAYLFCTWWLLTHRIDRFWVPMTPVVALLAGIGAAALWDRFQPAAANAGLWPIVGRAVCICAFVIVLPVNLLLDVSRIGGYNDYLLDLARAAQIAARVTAPEIVLLNERLPPGSKVLSVGDAQVFEARFPVVYNTVFDRSILEEWCSAKTETGPDSPGKLRSADEIRARFRDAGITHLYVGWRWILRYRSPGNYGYSDFVTPALLAELQQMGVLGEAWRIPNSLQKLSDLDPGWVAALQHFAPELIVETPDGPAYTTFQVFEVPQ